MSTLFETRRLILRRLNPADAAPMFEYRSLPAVKRYQCWEPADVAEIEAFIADQAGVEAGDPGKWCQLAIEEKSGGAMIGDLGLRTLARDKRQTEMGITVAPSHQRRGIAAEVLEGAIGHLFRFLDMHRVIASVDPRNLASVALMKRLGMRQEAHHIKSLAFKGEWADDMIFAMLHEDWREAWDA